MSYAVLALRAGCGPVVCTRPCHGFQGGYEAVAGFAQRARTVLSFGVSFGQLARTVLSFSANTRPRQLCGFLETPHILAILPARGTPN